MRAYEFITPLHENSVLREYKRDITARNYGDRLIQTLGKTRLSWTPDSLYNPASLVQTGLEPSAYPRNKIRVNILGHTVTYGPEEAPAILQQLKPEIIAAILAEIESHDPTPNKEYTEWLTRIWVNDAGKTKLEDLNRGDLLGAYTIGKRRRLIKPEHADINKFKTWSEFESIILQNYNPDTLRGVDKQERERGNAETVYEDDSVRVVVPHDETASCYYGQGTRWCTASTQGYNYFNTYNKQGKLYILLPKKPQYEGEKYQLHFPSGQFMDETDTPVNIYSLLSDGYPGLLAYFKKNEPEINEFIVFADDAVLKPIIEKIKEYCDEYLWDTITDWQHNDEYWMEWQAEQARNKGYVDAEGDIDWERVHDDDSMNDYLDFNDELRRIYRNIVDALNVTPEGIREAAGQMQESGDYDSLSISDMDKVTSYIVNEEVGKHDDLDITRWIDRYIIVKNEAPREPNAKPDWTVTVKRAR